MESYLYFPEVDIVTNIGSVPSSHALRLSTTECEHHLVVETGGATVTYGRQHGPAETW